MVVDPFSAASKPMPDWDSIPSRPLPFAATLEALDLNSPDSSSQRRPKPVRREKEGVPAAFPTPVYSPDRVRSPLAVRDTYRRLSYGQAELETGSDDWMQKKVEHCVDKAICELDISGHGLTTLSTRIVDLRDLVTLQSQTPTGSPSYLRGSPRAALASPPRPSFSHRLGERPFARTQSAPASADLFNRRNRLDTLADRGLLPPPVDEERSMGTEGDSGSPRSFTRSKTGAVSFRGQSDGSQPNLAVYIARNMLTSVLFEIQNITVLTLRSNKLERLPAAISALVHLKELNISNNHIRYLPSSITSLNLELFAAHPNKWLEPPPAPAESDKRSPRVLSRRLAHTSNSVPRLTSLCLITLLSPRPPSNRPPLVDFDWENCRAGSSHPLLDAASLAQYLPPSLNYGDVGRILQAVQSACKAASRGRSSVDCFPRSNAARPPDDGSENPYYRPCPSPRHQQWHMGSEEETQVTRRIFLDIAEERFEWLTVSGVPNLPVQWLGCSPGCLDFLENEDEGDEWLEHFGE